jgi:hypothetical protein
VREPSSNGRGNLLFLTPCGCSSSFVPDPCASFLLRFSRAIGGLTGREGGRRRRPLPPQAGRGTLAIGSPRSSYSNHRFVFRPHSPPQAPSVDSPFIAPPFAKKCGPVVARGLGCPVLPVARSEFLCSCEEDEAFRT